MKAQLRLEAMPRLEKDMEEARSEAKANGQRASEAERRLAAAEATLTATTADLERERKEITVLKTENKSLSAELGTARVQVKAQQVGLDAHAREISQLEDRVKEMKTVAVPQAPKA